MFNAQSIALPPPDATLAVGRTGRADVLIGATVPREVALPAITLLARRSPAVEVALHREEHAERLLVEGRADVAFLRGPLGDGSISEIVVADERRVALVPRWHRLARGTQTVLDDLRGEKLVEPRVGGLGIGRTTEHVDELLARVAHGDAVAVVPEGMLRGGSYAIVAVALADAPPSAILLAHRAVVTSAAAVMFVDAASEASRASGPRGVSQARVA